MDFDVKTWRLRTCVGSFTAGPQRMIFSKPVDVKKFPGKAGLTVIYGDARSILCDPSFNGAMFQVASNFGALEFMHKEETMQNHTIDYYPYDCTQGPSVQVSTLPQLVARVFFLKENTNMLYKLKDTYGVQSTESGWAVVDKSPDPQPDAVSLVGSWLVEKTDVVLGKPDFNSGIYVDSPFKTKNTVSLVMSSAYDNSEEPVYLEKWSETFLRGAYLNLFSAANNLGVKKVVMTLLGGGVFDNPKPAILKAIAWAAGHVAWRESLPAFYLNLYKSSHFFPEIENLNLFFRGALSYTDLH
jgi:hypothetical protein